jgi:membrane protease YdiL (CAAX protease family)
MKRWVEERPFLFGVGLAVVQFLLPIPLVVLFRVTGLAAEPLRLIIPIAESALALGVIWYLGWFRATGFIGRIENVGVYWYPIILAFVPVLLRGTVAIPVDAFVFFSLAILFTGISEEGLARGLVLRAALPQGKWVAVLFAAGIFSIGHLTNLFFEDFTAIQMGAVLLNTFAFGLLYGAVLLRTFNILPLMILHTIHDLMFVTSGTAGPFTTEPLPPAIRVALDLATIAYSLYVVSRVDTAAYFAATGSPKSTAQAAA